MNKLLYLEIQFIKSKKLKEIYQIHFIIWTILFQIPALAGQFKGRVPVIQVPVQGNLYGVLTTKPLEKKYSICVYTFSSQFNKLVRNIYQTYLWFLKLLYLKFLKWIKVWRRQVIVYSAVHVDLFSFYPG